MSAPRFGLLSYPGIENLGDTIQSLAAKQYLPRVDVLLPRERLSDLPGSGAGPVKAILNGWFMHDPRFWPPHPAIEPLLVSMHFVEPDPRRLRRWLSPLRQMLGGVGGEFLRRWGPVGARDPWTLEELEKRGIPAWHSGCLTLTLPRPSVEPTGRIVAADLSPLALARLRQATRREVVEVTHIGASDLDQAGQEAAAMRLLEAYAGAAAVVTTRIHAAQPCLAFGTPVLLLTAERPGRRIADVTRLVHHCTERAFLAGRCGFDCDDPPSNPDAHLPLARDLAARCRDYVANASLPCTRS